MSDQEFEDEAALLLAEYGKQYGQVADPPVPIDDVAEKYLKVVVELRDLRADYPEGDVLGAIYFNDKKIAIDQRLVPEDFPSMLGRYRFTLAHELAHWRLHRHLYLRRSNQRMLLPTEAPRADHILRSGVSDPKEVQANRFAACLLMPREMIKRVWHAQYGSMDPIMLDDVRAQQDYRLSADVRHRSRSNPSDTAEDDALLECAIRPLADTFQVSPQSMRIRLEGMGLLLRKKEPSLFE